MALTAMSTTSYGHLCGRVGRPKPLLPNCKPQSVIQLSNTARRRLQQMVCHAAEQAARAPASMPYVQALEEAPGDCSVSTVTVENTGHMTRMILESQDFPGLLRTITWVLHGMGLRVQNATLKTHDGVAHNNFWLTTWTGKKLNDEQASLMKERISDFVVYCEPRCTGRMEWQCRNLCVSNTAHPKYTRLVIEGEPKRQGFLLEMASVLDGTGACVQEAYIQSRPVAQEISAGAGKPVPELADVAPADYDFRNGRYFMFLLSDASGAKLDASRIGALLFSYDVFTDARHMPLIAPNMDTYLKQVEQGCA